MTRIINWLGSSDGYHAINAALWALFGGASTLSFVLAMGWMS